MEAISKKDWKLFQNRVGSWQEKYMNHLCEEYIRILQSGKKPSERFWELQKRIKEDKRSKGVFIRLDKKNALDDIIAFLNDEVITYADLDDFSDELKSEIKETIERRKQWMKID